MQLWVELLFYCAIATYDNKKLTDMLSHHLCSTWRRTVVLFLDFTCKSEHRPLPYCTVLYLCYLHLTSIYIYFGQSVCFLSSLISHNMHCHFMFCSMLFMLCFVQDEVNKTYLLCNCYCSFISMSFCALRGK